jgi:NADPH-ferrihemoprotein reductase
MASTIGNNFPLTRRNLGTRCCSILGITERPSRKLAGIFARECNARYGLRAMAADLDDYDYKHLIAVSSDKVLVFVLSTFGEGDPTDNSVKFCAALNLLLKEEGNGALRKL